jgi:hypothetical protein
MLQLPQNIRVLAPDRPLTIRPSERIAIMDTIKRYKLGDNQYTGGGSLHLATLSTAAKHSGFPSRQTAEKIATPAVKAKTPIISSVSRRIGGIWYWVNEIVESVPSVDPRETVRWCTQTRLVKRQLNRRDIRRYASGEAAERMRRMRSRQTQP